MKTIHITIEVDGQKITRTYSWTEDSEFDEVWGGRISDMVDTLEKSNEKEF